MSDPATLLISTSIRITATLTIAWLIATLLRRSSASARHLIWTCAMGVAVVTPVLVHQSPWQVPIPETVTRWSHPLDTRFGDRALSEQRSFVALDATSNLPPATDASRELGLSPVAYLGAIWGAGFFIVLVYMLCGALATTRLRRTSTAARANWRDEARMLAESACVPRVAFAESAFVRVPLVCGVVKPLVILPSVVSDWDAERRRVVLLHELAHVRRRDCLTQLLAQIACAMYWFHPLAWLAAHRLRVERERACDDSVLTAGVRGSAYARHLVAVAKNTFAHHPSLLASSTVAMAHRSQLEERVASILDPSRRRTAPRAARLCAVMFAVCALGLASLRLQAKMPDSISSVSLATVDIALVTPAESSAPQSSATAHAGRPPATVQSAAAAGAGRRFAVATVRAHVPSGDSFGYINTEPGGRFLVMNMPLRDVIELAFDIRPFQILDAPPWIQSARYDITALTGRDEDLSVVAMRPIIQTLLADRFQLDLERDTRIMQTYSLVRISPDALDPGSRRSPEGLVGPRIHPNALAFTLTGVLNAMVHDRTGLTELVGFKTPVNWQGLARDGVSSFAAVQDKIRQLGLTLEPRQAPVDVIAVKRIQPPVEQ